MKKLFSVLCVLILSVTISFSLFGCNDKTDNPQDNITPNYLADMQVQQSGIGAELQQVYKDGNDNYYFDFYIGKIRNAFVQPILEPVRNSKGLQSTTYKREEVSTSSIRNGITNTISTTKGVTLSSEQSSNLSWKFGTSASASVGLSVGILKGVSLSASATVSTAQEIAKSFTSTNSTTLSNSIAETISKNYDTTTEISQSDTVSTVYDMSLYERDLYYAQCLFATYNLNQIIVFNSRTNTLKFTYFLATISSTGIDFVSAENYEFEIAPEYQLSPINDLGLNWIKDAINSNQVIDIGEKENSSDKEQNTKPQPLVIFNDTIRTGQEKIHSTHSATDMIKFNSTISSLTEKGYNELKISVLYDIREVDDSYQFVTLYTPSNFVIHKEQIAHGGSRKNTNWQTYNFEKNVPLSQLASDILYLRYSAESYVFKDWFIGTVKVKIEAVTT